MDVAVIMRLGATAEMHDRMLNMVVDLEFACDKVVNGFVNLSDDKAMVKIGLPVVRRQSILSES